MKMANSFITSNLVQKSLGQKKLAQNEKKYHRRIQKKMNQVRDLIFDNKQTEICNFWVIISDISEQHPQNNIYFDY